VADEDRVVEGEVVSEGGEPPPNRALKASRSFFEPLSGAVILGVDWLAFGADFFSGFLALAIVAVAPGAGPV
jgi:hypothetical protein